MSDIVCCYSRRGRWHCLHIVDELAYVDRDYSRQERGYDWMDIIEWTVNATQNQPDIRRMAFDQWYFHSRKELDKFVTVLVMRFPGCTPPSS